MKHTPFIIALLFASTLWAEPVMLVGHRGSSYGIENTLDAFSEGIHRGYPALETDIRVTKDGHFVCSHDGRLSEWGFEKIVIENTTLKKLQKLALHQKRWNTYYDGKITTFEEYLDLCKERNIIPVIEFKHTTGINEKDISNLPKALQIVKDKGLMDKAVFISFMKAPLQYIREHEAPSANVQFLCMPHTERGSFEWMKQYHIDLDICQGFSREMVERYHAAGLKVNCWTIDNPAVARETVDFGVDMLTTNKLVQTDVERQPQPKQPTSRSTRSTVELHTFVTSSGATEGVSIYLPAGYQESTSDYPVLYLLHGVGDDELGWQERGNIVAILDSMIINGFCRPMVVVMPNGFLQTYDVTRRYWNDEELRKELWRFREKQFVYAFPEIIAWAENNYRIRTDRKNTAIAGLSMGGFHTFHIALSMPYKFDYVAPFSAVLDTYTDDELAGLFTHAPHLTWIACGKDDTLFNESIMLLKKMDGKGYPYTFFESTGGHSWKNWKHYITLLLPQLF